MAYYVKTIMNNHPELILIFFIIQLIELYKFNKLKPKILKNYLSSFPYKMILKVKFPIM